MRTTVALIACLRTGAAAAAERAIDKEALIPAGVDAAWQAWITTEGIRTFIAPDGRVEARVGGPFQICMDPGAEPGRCATERAARRLRPCRSPAAWAPCAPTATS